MTPKEKMRLSTVKREEKLRAAAEKRRKRCERMLQMLGKTIENDLQKG